MRFVLIFLMLSLLGAVNASAIPVVLGGAGDGDLALSEQELAECTPSSFLFTKRLGRVSFNRGSVCINCGDFSDNGTIGRNHVANRLNNDFLVFLKNQLFESNIFPNSVKERIPLRATLISLKQESSIGAAAEYDSRVTSGANLTTQVSIRYELIENEQVVGAWNITTRARSNSLAASTRLIETIDGALKRNVRVLLLKIIADYSPVDSARANQLIAALQGEADNTRSVMGYLVYGVTKTATTTAGVVGEVVKLAAQNSVVIADNINSTSAMMDKNNREFNAAVIESNRVLAAQAAERERARTEREQREADRRHDAERARAARADAQRIADARRAGEDAQVRQQEQTRRQEHSRQQEQERQQEQARQQKETRERDEARRKAEAEKVRLAAVEAAKPKWGPIQLEAVAICRQSKKSGMWQCDGPLDYQVLVDEPTLESALARQYCAGGTWAAGGPTLDGLQWDAYRCGHSLGAGDFDIVKRYGLITARRSYICPKDQGGTKRCTTLYDGQDKR